MSGNVWEWTRSLWVEDLAKPKFRYPYDPNDAKRQDVHAPAQVLRVLRGGSFGSSADGLRAAFRWNLAAYRSGSVGFRVGVLPSSLTIL